jgi:phosphoenolpyruvate-protein phosphotransferase
MAAGGLNGAEATRSTSGDEGGPLPVAPSLRFECPLPDGLHARPATSLAAVCEPFNADIRLSNRRNGLEAEASSVLAVISADVRYGDPCELSFRGEDASAAFAALRRFVERELPHCDDGLEALPAGGERLVPRSLRALAPRMLQGLGLAGGVAVGPAMVVAGSRIPEELVDRPGAGAEAEWQLIASARAGLEQALEAVLRDRHGLEAELLRAHLAIIGDAEYARCLHRFLADDSRQRSAAAAIAATIRHFQEMLGKTGNPYLAERAQDIRDVSMQLVQRIYPQSVSQTPKPPAEPVIVVAASLAPSEFLVLDNGKLLGLVLESGGRTSHTAILARSAGIPAVTGATGATTFATSGPGEFAADGNNGLLVALDGKPIRDWYRREQRKLQQIDARYEAFRDREAHTADGRRLEVAANIARAAEAGRAFSAGAEGIGLFRTEMLFMGRDEAPGEEDQFEEYVGALRAAGGKPVIVRTFDIGGDKPVPWLAAAAEDNPFLGVRGVRLYREYEETFRAQARALLRATAHGDLRILLPMISTAGELRWVRNVFEEERERLVDEGATTPAPRLGIMLEVPAAAAIIDQLAGLCEFISIGSNDLAQYFLACDRGNPGVAGLYSHYQPAFLRFLKGIVDDAAANGLWVGLCGEMAGEAEALPLLAGLGIDEISLAPPGIARSKAAIAGLDGKACAELLERAMACEDPQAVRGALSAFRLALRALPLFDPALVEFRGSATGREDVIRRLVDLAHLGGRTDDATLLEEAIWQREEVFSTGLGFGIAVPHCKSEAALCASLCIARLAEPVDWESKDGRPVDTVMLLIVPDAEGAEAHLRIFARLARRIMHEDFREALRACANADSLAHFLGSEFETEEAR